jgi:hypothetical protein
MAQSIAVAQGAAQLFVQNTAGTGWTPCYFRNMTFTDDGVNKDVTTTEQRLSGTQFLAEINTAVGFTLEMQSIRSEVETAIGVTAGGLDAGQERIMAVWTGGGGIKRVVFWKLIFPEANTNDPGSQTMALGSTDCFVFRASLQNVTMLGGGATDEAAFTFRIKTYGIIDFGANPSNLTVPSYGVPTNPWPPATDTYH